MSRPTLLILPLFLAISFQANTQTPLPDYISIEHTSPSHNLLPGPFCHGVASGDPTPDAVIIWTRVTPDKLVVDAATVTVKWEMALDEQFTHIEAAGEAVTSAAHDFTLKIDAKGLVPGTYYYYQFEAFGNKSPIGRTKTTRGKHWQTTSARFASQAVKKESTLYFPSPNEQVRLAVVSCNNYEAGYFNAFARIAEIPDLDAVVHLGDYIYEYGAHIYGDTATRRTHEPAHELVTLQDYRTRYAQYRLDPDLQEAHRNHPFICVWDDHEIANNAYKDGAENHQPEDGSFYQRKSAATQSFYEWLPVRKEHHLYRQFSFGNVADLIMLDERLAGREEPAKSKRPKKLKSKRSMLGEEQFDWLKNSLKKSTATWRIIGNQVLFAELNVAPVFPKLFLNFDAWDGYPAERQEIKNFLAEEEITNTVFITGDTHSSWSFDIPLNFKKYKKKRSGQIVAREFATPSVTSANFDEYKGEKTVNFIEGVFASPSVNPHLRYLDLSNHGYLLLTLTPYDVMTEWRFVEDIRRRTAGEFTGEKQVVKAVTAPYAARGNASTGGGK